MKNLQNCIVLFSKKRNALPIRTKVSLLFLIFALSPKALAIVIEATHRRMNWHWKEIKMYPFASDMISWVWNPTLIYIYNRHTHAHGQMLVKLKSL